MSATLQEWLRSNDLAEFEAVFVEHHVDLKTLQVLTEPDLKELGLPFGPRKRIMSAIGEFKRQAFLPAPVTEAPEAPGERRQLTVMFCDMVGFTAFASRLDPEVLQTVVRCYEDASAVCISRYEGYVFQRLGDGIVAFFGYPLAHEGEAERAIRAGREIVETFAKTTLPAVGKLQVRIGIANGVVVVAAGAKGAVGEAMNLAARLQALAEPGQLIITEQVRRLAGGVFAYADLGEQTLKGIARPARLHRVLGPSNAISRFDAATEQGITPMVGREDEITLLLRRWEQAVAGHGQVVLLSGEPGIGKSRMVGTLLESLHPRGAVPLRFQCSPFHVNSAFYPLVEFLERTLELDRAAPVAGKLDRLESLLVERFGRPKSDVPYVAAMLSLPFEERYGPSTVSSKRQKEETVAALLALLEAVARSQPTAVLFEDLHWADPTTLDVLAQLVENIRGIPLLVVLTARPEFRPGWPEHHHVSSLNLARLSRAQSEAIVAKLTKGRTLPAELLDQIIARTDGVPLFVEELTRTILESGSLRTEGANYIYAGASDHVIIPTTLRDSLMARLDRMAVTKEIAQIGAAIGREFSYELIAAVAGLDEAVLDDRLGRLTESGLAFRRGAGDAAMYIFKHALVQDVAYDSLLKSRRQELHARIAAVLTERFPEKQDTEPELLARHYSDANLAEAAVPLWQKAGENSLKRFAVPEAIAHFRKGLALLESLPAGTSRDAMELTLRTLMSPAVVAKQGWAAPEVCSLLEPALVLVRALNRAPSYLPVLHGLWIHFMSAGQHGAAIQRAHEMLVLADAAQDGELEIVAHRTLMTSHFWMGDFRAAQVHGDRIRAIYDFERHRRIAGMTNSDPLTSEGCYRAQYLWMLGYPDQAVAVSDAKDEHTRRHGHPFDLGFAFTVGALVFDYRGEPEKLLERAEVAERVCREHRIPLMSEMMAQIVKGVAWLRAGRSADSVDQLRTSIGRLMQTGHRAWVPYCRANLAEALALSGDLADALALIDECLAQIERQAERSHQAEALRLKGWILGQLGRIGEAEAFAAQAIAVARAQQAKSWELRAATTLAELQGRRGDRAGARALLAPVYAWFTEGLTTKDLVAARALLVELDA